VVGAESARSVLDRKIRLNELLYRAELLHSARAMPEQMSAAFSTRGERASSNNASQTTSTQGDRRRR
jgi:hypothetical protein